MNGLPYVRCLVFQKPMECLFDLPTSCNGDCGGDVPSIKNVLLSLYTNKTTVSVDDFKIPTACSCVTLSKEALFT